MKIDKYLHKQICEAEAYLQDSLNLAIDERQSTVYKAEMRKICHRIEKALHLVKDAQTIIGE